MLRFIALLLLAGTLAGAPLACADSHGEAPPAIKFTVVNLEYEGTKVWVPGTIAVEKGTPIVLKLINNVPSGQHGFSIPAYDVAVVVDKGEPATVEFTADREGIFPIMCHLHPTHIGGQLIVLP